MLSEEEEEEDEESEMEHKSRALKDPRIGEHLKFDSKNQSPSNPRTNEAAPRTQVFSGSSDEWTDKRIQECQE